MYKTIDTANGMYNIIVLCIGKYLFYVKGKDSEMTNLFGQHLERTAQIADVVIKHIHIDLLYCLFKMSW